MLVGCHTAGLSGVGKSMKKLLILPLLILMTSCVTYYFPQTALKDGIYYAEDDPSYVDYSGAYVGAAYYPWLSLDYFYLGYYSSRYYGYSSYYSPWYISHYHFPYYPIRRTYHGDCWSDLGCRDNNKRNHRRSRHDRYAGNNRGVKPSSSRSRKSKARGNRSRSVASSSSNKMSKASSRQERD